MDILEQQQTNEVLRLEIVYSNLYRAYISEDRTGMINLYRAAGLINIPNLRYTIDNEIRKIFCTKSPFISPRTCPVELLTTEQLKWNIEGCLNALHKELNQRNIYKANYTYAQNILYRPNHIFRQEEVLYQNPQGQQLKVSDVLAVFKYAISIAEAIAPDNENYAKANAAITTLQGIDAILNNKPEDKPVNKMLHLVTSFISSVVKSSIRNDEKKRGVTITALMVDLTIDFLCKN